MIITATGPVLYSSDKAIPQNYGAEVYYHGVKQEPWISKDEDTEVTNLNVKNIVRTSKVTRTGRVFSPETSPPKTITTLVHIPTTGSTADARGKEKVIEPAQTEAPPKDLTIEDSSKQEMEEILKIIRKSD